MRRAGHLWPVVIERDNLVLAFHRAARGKRRKVEVRRFAQDLDGNLAKLRRELEDGRFAVGRFHVFKVHDPKERTIHAARFPERVFQHALMNVCEPEFEQRAVFHSYACRKDKGRLAAVEAAQRAARRGGWHLKLDIRKYFESIPHDRLLAKLVGMFKDPDVLAWFGRIIRSHGDGRGLAIGSLTSQHLANSYLEPVDRLCQAAPGVRGYVRYMDDFVSWADDKGPLMVLGRQVASFAAEHLGLALKHAPAPQPCSRGMDFLGYRIFPTHTRLGRRSKVRYRRRLRAILPRVESGEIPELAAQQRLTALTAFLLPAKSWQYRRRVLGQFGSVAIGLQPGEPGRQLEQQRQQHPHGQPQQQQPRQQQQQCGVPLCPQLRPSAPDGAGESVTGLNRPPSRSLPHRGGDKTRQGPSGASSPGDAGSNTPGGPFFAAKCLRVPAFGMCIFVEKLSNLLRKLFMFRGGATPCLIP